MHWLWFSISLGIVLVTAYIFDNTSDEISYLAASISIVSLIVGLIVAPWEIQLLLLVVALVLTKGLSVPYKREVKFESDQKTQLLARNTNDEQSYPEVEPTKGEITRKYRGNIWKASNLEDTPQVPATYELKYRGASPTGQTSSESEIKQTGIRRIKANLEKALRV